MVLIHPKRSLPIIYSVVQCLKLHLLYPLSNHKELSNISNTEFLINKIMIYLFTFQTLLITEFFFYSPIPWKPTMREEAHRQHPGEAFTYGRKLKIEATNLIIGKIERLVSALLCEYVEFTSSLSMGNK